MRIAQIAPIIERVPAKKYGGTERVVHALTEELVKLGHEVTLFATGDSITSARLVSVVPKPLREMKTDNLYGANAWTLLNIGLAYKMQDQFDIIHDHNNDISLPTANLSTTPVVITLHGAFNENVKAIFEEMDEPYLVSISHAQSAVAPNLNYIGNVYNGLNMRHYPFSDTPGKYLLYVGRISREKGVHNAIKVANSLNIPLIIAAKLETESEPDVQYFHKMVKPYLKGNIRWIGEVDEEERNNLMKGALAFLHPLAWREPFGLTLIESMACGTPVIAFGLGSIPEIIVDGKTGFIVNSLDEMVEAVKNLDKIKRRDCRKHVLENFSAQKMAEGYESVYHQIIELEYKKGLYPQDSFMSPAFYAHDVPITLRPRLKRSD